MPPARSVPPLNAVRAFVAAARHGSFKQAAEELGVTHGAVSRQVHLLEQWLGRPALFRRLSRGVALTPDGEALLAEFGPALDRIAGAARQHRARRGATAATVLRVNALATFSLRWLLPRLALFRSVHPEIEVRLTTSNEPIDALSDDYDVVIRGGPDTFHGYASHRIASSGNAGCQSAVLFFLGRTRWIAWPIWNVTPCCTWRPCRGFGPPGLPWLDIQTYGPLPA